MSDAVATKRTGRRRLVLLAPLHHAPFRRLYAAQVISNLGDWLDLLALLALIAYQWRLGASALAALTLMALLPSAVVAPVAGVLVDRWPWRRVMVVCDVVRAALALVLVVAPNVVTLLATVLAMSVFSAFFSSARQVATRLIVPEDDLLQANALSRLSVNVTKVLGPGVGGVLVALVGPRASFVVDSLSFLVSAGLLFSMRSLAPISASAPAAAQHLASKTSFWREFRVGVAYIVHTPILAVVVGAQMLEMVIIETNDSLAVLAFKGVGMGEALVGLAIGCAGLGNVAGSLAIGQWGEGIPPLRQMGGAKMLIGVVEGTLGVALILGIHGGAAWFPLLILGGVGFAGVWIPFNYIVQRHTPPQLLGRVSSTAGSLITSLGLAGPPLGAIMAHRLGVGALFAITGGAIFLLGMALLLIRLPTASATKRWAA